MPLFKTIEVVKRYIPVAYANASTSIPRMQKVAEDQYLKPLLGEDLFNTLQTEADDSPADPSDLLDKVWMAAAYLMYYKEMPFIHTLITDGGLKNVTTPNTQGAYRYQYEDMLQVCENEGLASLERVWEFLYAHREDEDYTAWAASEAYARMNKNLIKTGAEFAQYYHLHQPHRTFYALQPIVQEVEDLFIIPAIGTAFFAELKDNATPSDEEAIVLKHLRKAIANFTIHKAIGKLSVKLSPEGFTVMLGGNDRQQQAEASANAQQLTNLQNDTAQDGNAYLNRAVKYLNDNASAELFATWFGSDLYKDPAAAVENVNAKLSGVYVM